MSHILYKSFKVPQQRSNHLLHCDIVAFVVSPPDPKSGFRPRGLQTHPGTTETVSMSPGKCTRSSVCSVVSKPMIPYWEIWGANCAVCPPTCEDLCEGTLRSSHNVIWYEVSRTRSFKKVRSLEYFKSESSYRDARISTLTSFS